MWDQEFDPFPPAVSPVRTTGSGATAPGTTRALGERRKRLVCGSSPSELRSYLVTGIRPGCRGTGLSTGPARYACRHPFYIGAAEHAVAQPAASERQCL